MAGSGEARSDGAGPAVVAVTTDRGHGDLAVDGRADVLGARRAAVIDAPWTWLRQVHGARVVTVTRAGEHAGAEADAAVTTVAGAPLAVHTADCGPLVLVGDGAVGVAHVGWRGLVAGVVEATAAAMAAAGHPARSARLGPCIRGRCYEFGAAELAEVAERYGPEVRTTTAWGTAGLELAAGIAAACASSGIELVDDGTCTACSPRHWSHRARGDRGRQALVAWLA